jgi:putative transposase
VTQRGVRSIPLFLSDRDRRLYLNHLAEHAGPAGIRFLAWCLMTNHIHLVVIPEREESLARGLGEAHRRFTRARNEDEGVSGYLFQGRFYSCPLDERHTLAAVRYIERNPVRAGLLQTAWEYDWSSAAFHSGERNTDPLLSDPDPFGRKAEWKPFLEIESDEVERVRADTRAGRPCGDRRFIEKMEQETGLQLVRRRPGRPMKKEE